MHRRASDFLKCEVCIIHFKERVLLFSTLETVASGYAVLIYPANYGGLALVTVVILADYGWTGRVGDWRSQQSVIGIEIN